MWRKSWQGLLVALCYIVYNTAGYHGLCFMRRNCVTYIPEVSCCLLTMNPLISHHSSQAFNISNLGWSLGVISSVAVGVAATAQDSNARTWCNFSSFFVI